MDSTRAPTHATIVVIAYDASWVKFASADDAAHLHDIIVGILSPAMRRGIDSRNRVWN
jgi:hypothetical protein